MSILKNRIDLHELLCLILGSRNAYFQPPPSIKIKYPAIVYSRSDIQNNFADDSVYAQNRFYTIIVIDKDPESRISEEVSKLPKCRFDRSYQSDNLNHDVYRLYF